MEKHKIFINRFAIIRVTETIKKSNGNARNKNACYQRLRII